MEPTDKELIENYRAGDEMSLEILIGRYLDPLYSFIYRMTKRESDTSDIVQESFVKAWRALPRYDSNKSFKTWIFSIARNTAIDFLRKKKSIVFSDFENENGDNFIIDTLKDAEPLPDEILAKVEDAKMLEKMLEEISPFQKEVLMLRYQDDLTFDEIGKVLEKPLDTVKSAHRRALIKLREMHLNKA